MPPSSTNCRELGHLPIEATEITDAAPRAGRKPFARGGVSDKQVTLFTRELSMLLTAGLPLERALALLSEQRATPKLAAMAGDLLTKVRAGNSLSNALEGQSESFPPLYINMVRAGEVSGSIEEVLMRLAEFREKAQKLRESLTGAMIYPAILVTVAAISVILLLTFVVPQFESLFADAGAALPLATQIVIAVARWCQSYGWLLIILLLAALPALSHAAIEPAGARPSRSLLVANAGHSPHRRDGGDGAFLPDAGHLAGKTASSCRRPWPWPRDTVVNRSFTDALDYVLSCVRDGRSLSEPLEETGIFPALSLQMLRVGEETGNLDKTLIHVAEINEQRLETMLKRMIGILEPALVIGIGVVIARHHRLDLGGRHIGQRPGLLGFDSMRFHDLERLRSG